MASSEESIDREALLLPFLVNGTLDGEDRLRLSEYLERSESARDEAAFLYFVRSSLQESARADAPSALERHDILQRIGREGRTRRPWRALAPWTLAAALALAVSEAAVIGKLALAPRERAPADPSASVGPAYRPAGAQRSAELAVQFADSATARQIRELLVEQGLIAVDGPSALGVYGLRRVDSGSAPAALQQVLDALRSADIVRYAGPR